jgi:endonuclease/exonuclease/phosphatase (EEP) superfamily protein YafD
MAAARLRPSGGPEVELVSVHPIAPRIPEDVAGWRQGLRGLPAAGTGTPLRVLAGDFNATLDHSELRRLLGTGYVDAAASTGAGLVATWPAGRRIPPAVTIDHVLSSRRIEVRQITVRTIRGTDHRAVVARLDLPES